LDERRAESHIIGTVNARINCEVPDGFTIDNDPEVARPGVIDINVGLKKPDVWNNFRH
jgi:hypothetical protein